MIQSAKCQNLTCQSVYGKCHSLPVVTRVHAARQVGDKHRLEEVERLLQKLMAEASPPAPHRARFVEA